MLRGVIVAAASVLLAATTASAQDMGKGFGQKGQFILSADRLVGLFSYTNSKTTDNSTNPSTSDSRTTTSFALLPNFNFASGYNFYNVPRIGFDYAVIDRLTIGGSIAVAFDVGSSRTQAQGGGSISSDQDKATYFSIAPRVGYALPLTDLFVFWPRAGLSFNLLHVSSPDSTTGGVTTSGSSNVSQWALSLEPLFVITPVQHFGIFAGPVLDIPLVGTSKSSVTTGGTTREQSQDLAQLHFGITAGLLGWL